MRRFRFAPDTLGSNPPTLWSKKTLGAQPLGEKYINANLVATSLLPKEYLFLGQCKCYGLATRIGRPDIDSFQGAVDHCLAKYEGNPHPPSHRVPSDFYRKNESCIRVHFSTADYTDTAYGAAEALDMILINGRQIAEFLVYHGIGIVDAGSMVDKDVLLLWASKFGPS